MSEEQLSSIPYYSGLMNDILGDYGIELETSDGVYVMSGLWSHAPYAQILLTLETEESQMERVITIMYDHIMHNI